MIQINLRSLIGSPILTEDQINTGEVTDAFVDLLEQRIVKFAVDWTMERRQVSGSEENLPFSQVAEFTPHWLIVAEEIGETAGLDLVPMSEGANVLALGDLLDHSLFDQQGNCLGTICDLFFDRDDGAISGYEVLPPEEDRPSMLLPPGSDWELESRGIVISDLAKAAMLEGRLRITSWEEEREEEDIEGQYEAKSPERRTVEPEPFDILAGQPVVTGVLFDPEALVEELANE
ncbi:MAG TPA: hypothetical protein V6C82_09820 [Chroococcales cyanobacterium]